MVTQPVNSALGSFTKRIVPDTWTTSFRRDLSTRVRRVCIISKITYIVTFRGNHSMILDRKFILELFNKVHAHEVE
jgi:hypothetical protein